MEESGQFDKCLGLHDPNTGLLVALYVYQILEGCNDSQCTAPFCRSNTRRTFQGRKIKRSACILLACHLTSLRADEALCEDFKVQTDEDLVVLISKYPLLIDKVEFVNPIASKILREVQAKISEAGKEKEIVTEITDHIEAKETPNAIEINGNDENGNGNGNGNDNNTITGIPLTYKTNTETVPDRFSSSIIPPTKPSNTSTPFKKSIADSLIKTITFSTWKIRPNFYDILSDVKLQPGSSGERIPMFSGLYLRPCCTVGNLPTSEDALSFFSGNISNKDFYSSVIYLSSSPHLIYYVTDGEPESSKNLFSIFSQALRSRRKSSPIRPLRIVSQGLLYVRNYFEKVESLCGKPMTEVISFTNTLLHLLIENSKSAEKNFLPSAVDWNNLLPHMMKSSTISSYHEFAGTSTFRLWPARAAVTSSKSLNQIVNMFQLNKLSSTSRTMSHFSTLKSGFSFQSDSSLDLPQYFQLCRYHNNSDDSILMELTAALDFDLRLELFRYGCLRIMGRSLLKLESDVNLVDSVFDLIHVVPMMGANEYLVTSPSRLKAFVMDIDRNHFLASAIHSVSRALVIEDMVRRPIKVRFGAGELAEDQGGVQVEFFQSLGYSMLVSDYGFFKVDSETRVAWFNPGFNGDVKSFEYLGILFALALYNGCTIGVKFPGLLYRILLDRSYYQKFLISDVAEISETVANSLRAIMDYEGVFEDLGLTFEYTHQKDATDETVVIKLPSYDVYPNGEVEASNCAIYVSEYCDCMIYTSVEPMLKAFLKGFDYIIDKYLIKTLDPVDLKLLAEGSNEIDIVMLRSCVNYEYYSDPSQSKTLQYFWDVVKDFSQNEKEQLLEFVTGSKRVPIGGISSLRFVIQQNGSDTERLPSSSVCFSTLLLPDYTSQQQLEKMLKLALSHSKGFGLV